MMSFANLFAKEPPVFKGRLASDISLKEYNSWRAGGIADYFFHPADLAELCVFLSVLKETVPVNWLGLGSNTLIRDGGLDGVTILTQAKLNKLTQLDTQLIRAEAGVSCAQLARFAARLGLTGLEFMAGIPGTVGGALAMNAGCFHSETWPNVLNVEMIDRIGCISIHPAAEFNFSYRSVERPINTAFVAATFSLQVGEKKHSLEMIKSLLENRNQTQPTNAASCGSVFRNPLPHYAGKLIEQCGLKGKRIGHAVVSTKHANFILNDQFAASASDIETLIFAVQDEVKRQTTIILQPEVHIIGRR